MPATTFRPRSIAPTPQEIAKRRSAVTCPLPRASPNGNRVASNGQVRSAHQAREFGGGGGMPLAAPPASSDEARMCRDATTKKTLSQYQIEAESQNGSV